MKLGVKKVTKAKLELLLYQSLVTESCLQLQLLIITVLEKMFDSYI